MIFLPTWSTVSIYTMITQYIQFKLPILEFDVFQSILADGLSLFHWPRPWAPLAPSQGPIGSVPRQNPSLSHSALTLQIDKVGVCDTITPLTPSLPWLVQGSSDPFNGPINAGNPSCFFNRWVSSGLRAAWLMDSLSMQSGPHHSTVWERGAEVRHYSTAL